MKQKENLSTKLLKNYFTIEGRNAKLKLVYDTFYELINPNFGDDKIEKLNDKLFNDIQEAVSLLPKRFKLDLEIVIKDFGNYQIDECDRIIRQNVYLVAYCAIKDNIKKRTIGFSLIATGAIILLLSYLLRDFDLWFDLINISGTLFVWEGVNMAFLERNIENKGLKNLARTIKNISVVGTNINSNENV